MFKGSMVALATPMNSDSSIDYPALEILVDFHLNNQTDGLVILGTTGESATVLENEHSDIIKRVIAQVAGQIPIISGVGTNCTETTIARAQIDTKLGVDALLIVTPYYNKPTQEGLYNHYKKVSQLVDNNVILYNAPGRTAVDLLPETVARLAELDNIIGIKETVSLERVKQLRQVLPSVFEIYCGDDANNLPMLEAGAQGLISVTGNVAPKLLHDMCHAYFEGDRAMAQKIHQQLMPLHKNLFIESNPMPVKFVLAEMGLINYGIRLPLTWLSDKHHSAVREAMQAAKIRGQVCEL